jgi:hypothetical protein
MTKDPRKPTLKVVSKVPFTGSEPARSLGEPGTSLWNRITSGYHIADAGGKELLLLACEATDRAVSLRQIIDREGEIIHTRNGPRDHPALRHELQNRALISKLLVRLGLDVEVQPPRPVGRPPVGIGITDPEDAS